MDKAEKVVDVLTGLVCAARPAFGEAPSVGQAFPLANSRFTAIAAETEHLPVHMGYLCGLLLKAADAPNNTGHSVLMPLWAEEAMHRAYALLRLLGRRAERDRGRTINELTAGDERAMARNLAAAYNSLTITNEDAIVPCSPVLIDVVLNLGALFGGGDGIGVRTIIERLNLPAYKRRALVLCASELIINALTHAFGDAAMDGRIDVTLRLLDDGRACLRIADNGAGFEASRPNTAVSVASGLAGLVEADLAYRRTADWTTIAEVVFPIATGGGTRAARVIDLARYQA